MGQRFRITQRILATSPDLVWVVWDAEDNKIAAQGSYTSCSNVCRELNQAMPETRLTQAQIDGGSEHRKGFFAVLSQIRNAVFPSTQIVR
jgi:hypothetical protein